MNEKHREVRSWLSEVFGDDPIPSYEVTDAGLDALMRISVLNRQRNSEVQLLVDVAECQTKEYMLESKRLSEICRRLLGAIKEDGSSELYDMCVNTLVEVSQILDLNEPNVEAISLALLRIKFNAAQNTMEERNVQHRCDERRTTHVNLLNSLSNNQDVLRKADQKSESIQQTIIPQTRKKHEFVKEKQKQYSKMAESYERTLRKNNVSNLKELFHSSLIALNDELTKTREQCTDVESKIMAYHRLPARMDLAEEQIEQAEKHLADLTQRIMKNMGSF